MCVPTRSATAQPPTSAAATLLRPLAIWHLSLWAASLWVLRFSSFSLASCMMGAGKPRGMEAQWHNRFQSVQGTPCGIRTRRIPYQQTGWTPPQPRALDPSTAQHQAPPCLELLRLLCLQLPERVQRLGVLRGRKNVVKLALEDLRSKGGNGSGGFSGGSGGYNWAGWPQVLGLAGLVRWSGEGGFAGGRHACCTEAGRAEPSRA